MGQCFGKKKKNKVSPSPIVDDVGATLSRGTPFQQPAARTMHYADMAKYIAEAQDAKVTDGGLAFVVHYKEGDASKMPPRLASRIGGDTTSEKADKVEYTTEEKEIMAGMMRQDFLESRRQKAWRDDVRQFDVARRRVVLAADKELRAQSALDKATPSLRERMKKVKDMAEEARSKVKIIEVKPAIDKTDNGIQN